MRGSIKNSCGGAICVTALLIAGVASGAASPATARLWNRVTPAAGVPIRSAANFRVFAATSTGAPSVDIYQINTDGSSTKLDTIASSPGGAYGSGTYSTRGMAAIYWQFTSLPPASGNPPPVAVTFINDIPAIPLSALYETALPQTPFASTDPSLLLNIDLRAGAPSGWSNSGSGTFDATNGYSPGNDIASGVANPAVAALSRGGQMTQGTVAVRFQRIGVTTDNSFGSRFWDSTGNTLNATTQNRQLFQMRANSGNWTFQALVVAATIPYLDLVLETNSMAGRYDLRWQTVNSHYVAGYQDPTFADLMLTWYQNQYYIFFDGHLLGTGILGDIPIYAMFQNICVGNSGGTGASAAPFGSYHIQQIQISSRFLGPVMAGPTIGLIPDSFAAGYTQRFAPTPTGANGKFQVSDVDAVQNALGLYSGIDALFVQAGQTAPFPQIQALMFRNYGFFPPVYDAGQDGHGYSSINAPIDDAFIAALNHATPAVVMAGGTVNDVNPFTPSDGNIVADTEAIMRRLAQGGGSRITAPANPSLEQIIYLETLSSQAMPSAGPYSEPAYATASQNTISITRAGLSNLALPNSLGFSYLTSREWWNEAPDYPYYLYGSSPSSLYNGVGASDYQNVHPDPTGYSVIASHLYGAIASAVVQTRGASLSLTGSGTENATGSVSYSVLVSNAGPLPAVGAVVTATLPSGASLVNSSSSFGCTQSGSTLMCALGTVAAGASTSLLIGLLAPPSTQVSLSLSASSMNANSGTGASAVVASGIAVPDVVGSTRSAAGNALATAGLSVGTVVVQASDTVAIGIIVAQHPLSGIDVSPGAAVDLVVSGGIAVPNLVGSAQSAASAALTASRLTLGTVTQVASKTADIGTIVSQTPAPGASVAAATSIDIAVSSGIMVPDTASLSGTLASKTIVNTGLVVGVVTTQTSASVPYGDVISQSPAASTNANPGSSVDLMESAGPPSVEKSGGGALGLGTIGGLIVAAYLRRRPGSRTTKSSADRR